MMREPDACRVLAGGWRHWCFGSAGLGRRFGCLHVASVMFLDDVRVLSLLRDGVSSYPGIMSIATDPWLYTHCY